MSLPVLCDLWLSQKSNPATSVPVPSACIHLEIKFCIQTRALTVQVFRNTHSFLFPTDEPVSSLQELQELGPQSLRESEALDLAGCTVSFSVQSSFFVALESPCPSLSLSLVVWECRSQRRSYQPRSLRPWTRWSWSLPSGTFARNQKWYHKWRVFTSSPASFQNASSAPSSIGTFCPPGQRGRRQKCPRSFLASVGQPAKKRF